MRKVVFSSDTYIFLGLLHDQQINIADDFFDVEVVNKNAK